MQVLRTACAHVAHHDLITIGMLLSFDRVQKMYLFFVSIANSINLVLIFFKSEIRESENFCMNFIGIREI